jgi:hypothetical protein
MKAIPQPERVEEVMTLLRCIGMLGAVALLPLAACDQAKEAKQDLAEKKAEKAENAERPSDPVGSALAAAPASVSARAAIVQAQADGSMKMLREGGNGWTCMPDNPQTPGHDPMCMDANALKWAEAWMAHKAPPEGAVGLMYMLEGGSDASNTDPWGTKPAAGHDWVDTGPHVMVVGSKEILAGYPSGERPDTSAPYVMFAGTPYAHLMIPIGTKP